VRAIRAAVRLPVVTIGALTRRTPAAVIRAGADGICVVSAIVAASDPCAAARWLRRIVEEARRPTEDLLRVLDVPAHRMAKA